MSLANSITGSTPASFSFVHPDYGCAWEEWKTVEDVCAGTTWVKRESTRYLPKLGEQSDDVYRAVRKRAVFCNASRRTMVALCGLVMRKPPVLTIPDGEAATQPLMRDVTMTGMSVQQYIRTVSDAAVSTGRMVTVIDYSAEQMRPYVATYKALDVLNWSTGQHEGHRVLALLIVRECEEVLEGFVVKKQDRFRSYRLVNGQVLYKTWAAGDADNSHADAPEKPMMRRGKPLTRIPAVFHNANHLGPEIGEAPLYDIAEINVAHYRGSADLENGRHFAGLPTPWATGVDDSNQTLTLGTTKMLTTEKPDAKFGFLEFTGTGLGEITKGQEEKERQMAVLGARLLFDAKKDAESFETVRLRAASENAALSNIAGHLTVTLTEVLQWFYWWQGTAAMPTDVLATVVMNMDFIDTTIDGTTLAAYVSAFQQNAISFETFFNLLKKGEVYPDDWDMDREAAAITQRPPATMPTLPLDPNLDPEDDPGDDPPADPPAKPATKKAATKMAAKKAAKKAA